MSYLSMLPVDVLILAPDLNHPCCFEAPELLELRGSDSVSLQPFPRVGGSVQIRTTAAHAEREVLDVLYGDTGRYKDHQFGRADTIILHTAYDELFQLWNKDLSLRSSFSTTGDSVNMPVLFASILGVEKGKPEDYWYRIKELIVKDTLLIRQFPYLTPGAGGEFHGLAVRALKDGRLQRQELLNHRQYPFGMLRQ